MKGLQRLIDLAHLTNAGSIETDTSALVSVDFDLLCPAASAVVRARGRRSSAGSRTSRQSLYEKGKAIEIDGLYTKTTLIERAKFDIEVTDFSLPL